MAQNQVLARLVLGPDLVGLHRIQPVAQEEALLLGQKCFCLADNGAQRRGHLQDYQHEDHRPSL